MTVRKIWLQEYGEKSQCEAQLNSFITSKIIGQRGYKLCWVLNVSFILLTFSGLSDWRSRIKRQNNIKLHFVVLFEYAIASGCLHLSFSFMVTRSFCVCCSAVKWMWLLSSLFTPTQQSLRVLHSITHITHVLLTQICSIVSFGDKHQSPEDGDSLKEKDGSLQSSKSTVISSEQPETRQIYIDAANTPSSCYWSVSNLQKAQLASRTCISTLIIVRTYYSGHSFCTRNTYFRWS